MIDVAIVPLSAGLIFVKSLLADHLQDVVGGRTVRQKDGLCRGGRRSGTSRRPCWQRPPANPSFTSLWPCARYVLHAGSGQRTASSLFGDLAPDHNTRMEKRSISVLTAPLFRVNFFSGPRGTEGPREGTPGPVELAGRDIGRVMSLIVGSERRPSGQSQFRLAGGDLDGRVRDRLPVSAVSTRPSTIVAG